MVPLKANEEMEGSMARSKGWSQAARCNARKYSGVLKALAKHPEEHLEEIFRTPDIGPQAVEDALRTASSRKELNWRMGWARDWQKLLEKREDLWPPEKAAALWSGIWRLYGTRCAELPGKELPLSKKVGR
jgi:hypothetical protein